MKKTILFLLPVAFLMAEQRKPAAKPAAPAARTAAKPAAPAAKPAAPAETPDPNVPPPGAVEISPRVWRYTDKAGKVWIYRPTMFGLSRVEESAANAPAAPATTSPVPVQVKVHDMGETVRFEAPSPMGPRVWSRRKSELTAEEQKWLETSKGPERAGKATEK
jgi:hypothetical protein